MSRVALGEAHEAEVALPGLLQAVEDARPAFEAARAAFAAVEAKAAMAHAEAVDARSRARDARRGRLRLVEDLSSGQGAVARPIPHAGQPYG